MEDTDTSSDLRHAFMTQGSCTPTHTTVETPARLKPDMLSRNDGTCTSEQAPVKAPGTPNITTLRPGSNSNRDAWRAPRLAMASKSSAYSSRRERTPGKRRSC